MDKATNLKEIVDPDCHHYILDETTGKVVSDFGGGLDWTTIIIIGAVLVGAIFILPKILPKKSSGGGTSFIMLPGGGGSSSSGSTTGWF